MCCDGTSRAFGSTWSARSWVHSSRSCSPICCGVRVVTRAECAPVRGYSVSARKENIDVACSPVPYRADACQHGEHAVSRDVLLFVSVFLASAVEGVEAVTI